MKVLLIADVPMENPTSGSEQVLYQQASGLFRQGMKVYAITRQEESCLHETKNINGVYEAVYQASLSKIFSASIRLLKYPSKYYLCFEQGETFHGAVCHQPFNCFSLLIRKKLKQIPFIYVFHSPSHEEFLLSKHQKKNPVNLFHAGIRLMVERICIIKSRKVMVLSRYMKQKVIDIHKISSQRIVVNPGGVDLDRFRPLQNRDYFKNKLGFPENKIHLFTLRNLEPRMGLENLLEAIRIIKQGKNNVHLILAGEGPERKKLHNLIHKLKITNEVTMAGFIPTDTLSEYYGASDFFILPTRYLEGFGLITIESMACGTPVMGTPVGGTIEILSGFDPEFLFADTSPESMANGIRIIAEKIFTNKEKYGKLRLHCREHAAKYYSWQRHTDKLKSIIEDIL